jgi:hypothetical protein
LIDDTEHACNFDFFVIIFFNIIDGSIFGSVFADIEISKESWETSIGINVKIDEHLVQ